MKINRFEDLEAWQESRKLIKLIYEVVENKSLKKDYRFRDQVIGSALSIMNNIAEGFGSQSTNEFIRFLQIARRSVFELESCLYVASDNSYLNEFEFKKIFDQSEKTIKIIDGLLRYLRNYRLTK